MAGEPSGGVGDRGAPVDRPLNCCTGSAPKQVEKSALVKRASAQVQSAEERFDAKLYALKQRHQGLRQTATKYAEERAELLLRIRELEAKLEAAGISQSSAVSKARELASQPPPACS